jgi:site-specific recombinase XerC
MSRSRLVEQNEPLPYNHHLQPFLTFLKQERGFANATIVNRRRSLKPFLAWLVEQCIPLSAVSPVVITKLLYRNRGGPVGADNCLVTCTVSALVLSLCQLPWLVLRGHR